MKLRVVGAVALAVIVAGLLAAFGPRPQFTADGYDYAIVMLMDRGMPYAQAQAQAARFYARTPIARNPLVHPWLTGKPEYWELFSVRSVYPWLASRLYPYRGFRALVDVSRVSYMAVAMLVVLLGMRFAPLRYAVLLSIGVSLFPPWRDIARDALTDPLAVALAAGALLAAAACMTRLTPWRVIAFAVLCGLLTFTRPIPYIILGAGVVAGLAAPRRGDRSGIAAAAWITGIAALCAVGVEVALTHAHVPSFRWIVADTYQHFVVLGYAPAGETLRAFFVHEELTIAGHALLKGLLSIVPVLAIAGMVLRRADPATPLLAGACAATWFGALVDPDRFDVIRCVVMPVVPVLAAFAAAALAVAARRVPRALGLLALSVRYFITRRVLVRNTTVKE